MVLTLYSIIPNYSSVSTPAFMEMHKTLGRDVIPSHHNLIEDIKI